MKLKILFSILIIIPLSLANTDNVVWQGQYYIGNSFQTGTYNFNFSVFDSLSGGTNCYENITNLTTGNWGEWRTTQYDVSTSCSNASKDYYLEITINNITNKVREGTSLQNRSLLTNFNSLRRDVDDTFKGNLTIEGVTRGKEQLKLEETIAFLDLVGNEIFSIYRSLIGKSYNDVPDDFNNSLIFQTTVVENPNAMEVCFWDDVNERMMFCINQGALFRATTIRRSLQIVNNVTLKENDENFTLCEGANYVDCSTDITGADLFVADDIEALGSIYTNEYFIGVGLNVSGDIYANGTIDSEDGIGVPIINAINISSDNINADLIQSTLGKFTNITGDKLNIDLIFVINISADNLEVNDLITGSNAGTDLCVDTNNALCICGSCA